MLPQLLVESKRQRKSCLPLFRILAGTDSGAPTCLRSGLAVLPTCKDTSTQAGVQGLQVSVETPPQSTCLCTQCQGRGLTLRQPVRYCRRNLIMSACFERWVSYGLLHVEMVLSGFLLSFRTVTPFVVLELS